MKLRIIAVLVGASVAMALLATPASAAPIGPRAHRGTEWYRYYFTPEGSAFRDVGVSVNVKDDPWLGNFAEGLVHIDGDGAAAQMRVDWMHLYRDGDLVRSSGPTGWMNYGDNTFSTSWNDTCGGGNAGNYRAVARYQLRHDEGGTWSVGDWHRHDSMVEFVGCG